VSAPWRLACGQRIWFEDEQHLVEGLLDNAVRLRSQTGRVQIILLGALLAPILAQQIRPWFWDCIDDGR
jgi:hypothetical protein